MNYEKFNDAMCRLRQAEEDLNKVLQDVYLAIYEGETLNKEEIIDSKIGNFTSHMTGMNTQIDAKLKKLQEKEEQQADLQAKIDEAYNKGLQDLYDALHIFSEPVPEMREIFDSVYIEKIILKYSPKEIIDKVNQWKAKKDKEDKELHVGDEIEYMYPGREPEKCIVINLENGIENEKIIWTIGLDLSQLSWFSSNCYWGETYRKTGKHYDSIPLKKEENK